MKRRNFIKGLVVAPAAVAAKGLPETPCHEWEFLEDTIAGVVFLATNENGDE